MLNHIVMMGRLTKDPELRQAGDTMVCSFRIACDRDYKNKAGEKETDFVDVVVWRKLGETVAKYFTKGRMIAVTGSLQTRTWEDKNGSKHKAVELVAQQVSFCGDKAKESDRGEPAGQEKPKAAPQEEPAPSFTQGSLDDFVELDDSDLPF